MADIFAEIHALNDFYSNFRFVTRTDRLRRERVLDLDGLTHALAQSADAVGSVYPASQAEPAPQPVPKALHNHHADGPGQCSVVRIQQGQTHVTIELRS